MKFPSLAAPRALFTLSKKSKTKCLRSESFKIRTCRSASNKRLRRLISAFETALLASPVYLFAGI
jgi:hypothetical protein